ncbi:MAG TPA: VTT domain-containing protein [Hyphomicrobiaceae bacterium]|nr:VTT domain-containing protein [Hyphomicrobiaceae bacterium]
MAPQTSVPTGSFRRLLPAVALIAVMAVAYWRGWHQYLSFKTIGLNYELLKGFIESNLLGALAIFVAAYIAVVALSLPGALIMSLSGGLLFGWKLGTPAIVLGATTGATILFLIANTSLGEPLARRAGPALTKLREGFRANAMSYLLFLRLVPAFPFVVINLAAALLGVPLRTFIFGTALGIIPGSLAYATAGSGLGSVVEAQNAVHKACLAKTPANPDVACPYSIDTSALITKELIAAFILLSVVALIPVAIEKWRARHAA